MTIIDTKQEERKVKCEWQYEWLLGVKRLFRTDTFEQIDSDTIRESERQQHLRLTDEVVPGGFVDVSDVLPGAADPEEDDDEITICCNKDCENHSPSDGNGCNSYEYVSECDQVKGLQVEPLANTDCDACHSARPGCDDCCNSCETGCNAAQTCRRYYVSDDSETPETGIPVTEQNQEDAQPQSFENLIAWGYGRNEGKILSAGFRLVKYSRDEKQVSVTGIDPRLGWRQLPAHETWAAAERELEKFIAEGLINVCDNTKGTVSGHKCMHALREAGFSFYRKREVTIHSDPNWKQCGKYEDADACSAAWEELLSTDPKALED